MILPKALAATLLICIPALTPAEDHTFLFELEGTRSNVGSWVVVQKTSHTAVMITPGETRTRRHGEEFSRVSQQSTLQLMCGAGRIWAVATLPNAAELSERTSPPWPAIFVLRIDGELVGTTKRDVDATHMTDGRVTIPLISADAQSPLLSQLLGATSVSISATNLSLFKVTADFKLSGSTDAFQILTDACK